MQIPLVRPSASRSESASKPSLWQAVERYGGRLAAVLFGLWLLDMLLIDATTAEFVTFRSRHLHFGLLSAIYAIVLIRSRRLPGPTPLDMAAGALVLVYAGAIILSPYQAIALEAGLYLATAVVLFYALRDLSLISTEALVRSLVVGVSLMALLGLKSAVQSYADALNLARSVGVDAGLGYLLSMTPPRSGGAYHPNVLAMVLNLALPFAAVLALSPRQRIDRLIGVTALLICLPALLFTLSRGGWLATMAGACVFVLAMALQDQGGQWLRQGRQALTSSRLRLAATLSMALAVGLVLAALLWGARDQLLFRDSVSSRVDILATAIDMFGRHPLLGSGPNSFALLYESFDGKYGFEALHPHNAYLLALIDVGLVGALVYTAGLAIVIYALCAGLSVADSRTRLLLIACAAALTTLLIHGLFDSPFTWHSVLIGVALITAVVFRLSPLRLNPPRPLSLASRLLVLALIPLLLVAWVIKDGANASYDASLRALENARFSDAARLATDAAAEEPSSTAYQLNAGVTSALQQLVSGSTDAAGFDAAFGHLLRAVEDDPRSFLAYANLAQLYRQQDDPEAAVEAVKQAMAYAQGDPNVAILAGSTFEWAGQDEDAVAAYAVAVGKDARLSQSAFWSSSTERLQLRDRVIAATGLTLCQVGASAALYGEVEPETLRGCQKLVEAAPRDAGKQASLALMLEATGRHLEAETALAAAEHLAPDTASVHLARAVVLAAELDLQTRRNELLDGGRDGRLLLALSYLDAGEPVPEPLLAHLRTVAKVSDSPLGELDQDYVLGQRYFSHDLLREAPAVLLLPGEWQELASPLITGIREVLAGADR